MWLAAAAVLLAARPVAAGILDEVWVGGYAHDFDDSQKKESGTQEIEFEVDTAPPPILHVIGSPRIAVTMAFNTGGKTDFGGVALAWERRLVGRLSGTLQFGLDGNDGDTRAPPGPAGDALRSERLQLGSNVLFREAVGLDWRLNDRLRVGAQYIHESTGQVLAHGPNEGINELGMRLGYRLP